MNQFRKIGTVRLRAGFFVCFLVYPNNKYWSISNIFSEHLEFTSKKIILRKNYSRGIWTLCLHPQSYANGSFRKLHFILARLGWNLNILDRFSQNTQISNFINIRPESPSFSMQTDMKKPKVAFRSSANVSKSRSQLKKIIRFFRYVINKKILPGTTIVSAYCITDLPIEQTP